LAVAIPGSLKGYSAVYKSYGGGVSWESLFEPTIQFCEEGMKISEHLWSVLKTTEELIKNDAMLRYNTIIVCLCSSFVLFVRRFFIFIEIRIDDTGFTFYMIE